MIAKPAIVAWEHGLDALGRRIDFVEPLPARGKEGSPECRDKGCDEDYRQADPAHIIIPPAP
jgi:hypothetical protein